MEKRLDIGRFRPTSWADFKQYASNLAWLLQIELSRGHELLARSYGFSDCHELQAVMKQSGSPGFSAPKQFIESTANERLLHLSMAELELSPYALPKRAWLVRDCSFFAMPGEHRSAFRRIRQRLQVVEGADFEGGNASAADYAVLQEFSDTDRVQLTFTELGQAVFDALIDTAPDRFFHDGDWESREDRLLGLIHRYPSNPWVHAVYVCSFGRFYFQGGWAEDLPVSRMVGQGYEVIDNDPGFPTHAPGNAAPFLEHAKTAIRLFDELLEGKGARHVDHEYNTSGSDAFYYPAILYYGACVAANAGEEKLAIHWAELNRKIVGGDNFGARDLLAALYLNDCRAFGQIKKLHRKDEYDGWASLCQAAAAAAHDDKAATLAHITKLLEIAWTPIEEFGGIWPEARTKCGADSKLKCNKAREIKGIEG